jgi:hypothetical protein
MLVIHDDKTIYGILKGETPESLERHIRAGFPELIEAYEKSSITATEIDDKTDAQSITLNAGKIREWTKEEMEAKKPPITPRDPDLGKQITATLREMALERISAKKIAP